MNIDFLAGIILGGLTGAALAFWVAAIIQNVAERSERKRNRGRHEK